MHESDLNASVPLIPVDRPVTEVLSVDPGGMRVWLDIPPHFIPDVDDILIVVKGFTYIAYGTYSKGLAAIPPCS